MLTFEELGVSAQLVSTLARQGIVEPVAVQAESVPSLLDKRDVVIEAPTGSGKTLAYLLPLVSRISTPAPGPRALILTPTRELAVQVESVFRGLGLRSRSALLYGGIGYHTQTQALKAGADVVIGTPGRIIDMVERRLLTLSRVEYLVLDEADEMLDYGFGPSVKKIIGLTYQPQMVMCSATMPEFVRRVIDEQMVDPLRVTVEPPEEATLEHGLLRTNRHDRLDVLARLLETRQGAAIVFGRTKHGVHKLARDLRYAGVHCLELQGNLSQTARDRTMAAFRNSGNGVLVATNVAARGLDIGSVDLVINFELPDTAQSLTHRIGRTARMGRAGRAITLLIPEDHGTWTKLRRLGAPALPELDGPALLQRNQWIYLERSDIDEPERRPAAAPGRGRAPGRGSVPGPNRGFDRRREGDRERSPRPAPAGGRPHLAVVAGEAAAPVIAHGEARPAGPVSPARRRRRRRSGGGAPRIEGGTQLAAGS